jgi:hypothetical protein
LAASGVPQIWPSRRSRRSTPFDFRLLILYLRIRRLELFELLCHHLFRVDLVNDIEKTNKFGLMPWQNLQLSYQFIPLIVV